MNLIKKMKKMKKSAYAFFAVSLIISVFVSCNKENPSSINGQDSPQFALGCQLLPKAEYLAVPLANAPKTGTKTLPAILILPTPPVGNQGSEGSCVAWGTTYAGRSIDWYETNQNTTYSNSTNIFSPEYVFNQIKIGTTCTAGSYVTAGLDLLNLQGVCTWASMPSQSGCTLQPNQAQITEAANYKTSSYERITIDAITIKTFLATNKPVIVAGPVNTAFEYLANGAVLGAFTGSVLGGHCYCVVGYDDSKNAFKFQNSWGSGWSSSGFGWINYSYVTSWWTEAYIINTTGIIPPPPGSLPVSVSIAPSENPVCNGTLVTFTATPTNGGTAPHYQWKNKGSNVGTNSPVYAYKPINGAVITCVLTSNVICPRNDVATSNAITMIVKPPYLTLSPLTRSAGYSAGNTWFSVTSNCEYTVSSDASWCIVTPSTGIGNHQISAVYSANPGEQRTATITISSATITVLVTVVQNKHL